MVPQFSSYRIHESNTRYAATGLTHDKRKAIALQALAGTELINALAEHNGVGRPTVYRQISAARAVLNKPSTPLGLPMRISCSSRWRPPGNGSIRSSWPSRWSATLRFAAPLKSCATCSAYRSAWAPFTPFYGRPLSGPSPSTPALIFHSSGWACTTNCFRDRNPCSPASMWPRLTAICSLPKPIAMARPGPFICWTSRRRDSTRS